MSKFRTSIFIIGMLVIVVAASLLTVFALYITGAVVTERIDLVYAVSDEVKVYDGMPLLAEKYELVSGELQAGHHAEAEFFGSQTDAGESESSLSVRICDEKGNDVTREYNIGINSGRLVVLRKDISVTLNDEEVTYNGAKVSFEDYTITEGELVSGHRIAGSQNVQLINVDDVLPSDLNAVVFDAAGKDVTDNYNVTFTMGRIRVVARPVTVKPADKIKVYDGEEVKLNEVEILAGSLADDQYFKAIEINNGGERPVDVCNIVTRITQLTICQRVGSEEIDVTENYDIDTSETGVVRIEQRKLTITAKSGSWEYDGLEHSLTDDYEPLSCEGLAPGEALSGIEYEGSRQDAGTSANKILAVHLVDNAPLSNYAVTLVDGTLTVTKREITIFTPTRTKTYDGKPLLGAEEKEAPIGSNLAEGQVIAYSSATLPSLTDHGTQPNRIDCKIVASDDPNTDLAGNYKITYVYGDLIVNKRTVRVSTPSYSKVFDGVTLYGFETPEEIYTDELAEGHTLVVPKDEDRPHITDVATVSNAFTVSISNGDEDVTDNYDLDYRYGTLAITRLTVTVRTASVKREYNGEELQGTETQFGYIPNEGELQAVLAEGEDFPSLTDVGTEENRVLYKLQYNGEDVDEKNYNFDYQYGKLEITRCNISLTLNELTATYNGKDFDLAAHRDEALEGNTLPDFLTKEAFVLESPSEQIIDAGSYFYRVGLAEGNDPQNFLLNVAGGTIKIEQFGVIVTLSEYKKEYNGEIHTVTNESILLSGEGGADLGGLTADAFRIVPSGEVRAAGSYTYTVQFIDGNNEKNYRLYIIGGEITITKYKLNINGLDSYERIYSGESQLPDISDVMRGVNLPKQLTYADFRVVSNSGSVVDVGRYTYTVQMIDASEALNYELTVATGNVTINKRDITFTLSNYIYYGDSAPSYLSPSILKTCLGVAGLAPLPSGFSLSVTDDIIIYNYAAGTITIYDIEEIKILNAAGEDVTKNFNVTNLDEGSLSSSLELRKRDES